MNKFDAAKAVPCHHRTASRMLARMHEEKLIRIVDWTYSYKYPIPIYAFGRGENCQRPKPMANIESVKKYRSDTENQIKIIKKKQAARIIENPVRYCVQDEIFNLIVLRST